MREHAWSETEKLLTSSFGDGWRDVIETTGEVVGSGCIAQVYSGVLNDPNMPRCKVAIKVIHPDVKVS